MALSSLVIYIKRGGNAPPVTITFNDAVLTGSAVEMVLTPTNGAPAVTISTDDDELVLSLPSSVVWTYSEDRADGLPSGARTLVDFWRVFGNVREAIGSGVIHVLKAGEAPPSESISITVPGIQGARGWAPLFAAVASGTRRVLQIADWTGGGGDKPAIGQYLGSDGLVDDIEDATDIRGATGSPGAPGEPLALVVSDMLDTGPGGWWIARDYHGAATFPYLRAEMLVGTATGVTLSVRKNGTAIRSGIALGSGATIITDLGLVLAKGDQVSVQRESGGTLTGPWVMLVQIDGREP